MPNALDIGILPPAPPALVAPGFDAAAVYDRIRTNLRQIDSLWYKVCEDLRLLKAKGYSVRDIAKEIGEARSTVGDYLKLTEFFPDQESLRLADGTIAGLTSARIAYEEIKKLEANGDKVDRKEILENIVGEGLSKKGARRKTEDERIKKRIAELLVAKKALRSGLCDCYNMDCRDVARWLATKSRKIDMFWLDFPYPGYSDSQTDDCLRGSGYSASVMTNCSYKQEKQAVGILRELIPLLTPLSHEESIVVYWGNGRKHDHEAVTRAFRRNGWDSIQASLWVKPMTACGSFDSSDAANGERYVVYSRGGRVKKTWAQELGRGGLIRGISPVRNSVRHLMEKPEELADFFFRKYLEPKSLIWDAYGCSGSACVAAIESDRQHGFIYSEHDYQNFQYGTGRIAEALNRKRNLAAAPLEDLPF